MKAPGSVVGCVLAIEDSELEYIHWVDAFIHRLSVNLGQRMQNIGCVDYVFCNDDFRLRFSENEDGTYGRTKNGQRAIRKRTTAA